MRERIRDAMAKDVFWGEVDMFLLIRRVRGRSKKMRGGRNFLIYSKGLVGTTHLLVGVLAK